MSIKNAAELAKFEKEVLRLADNAKGDWCPNGGWQFPFDFGNGIKAPTYTSVQTELHPWRRKVMMDAIENMHSNFGELSVLDLGSGEGAMSIALWQKGIRDITCVEIRKNNIEKAKFACDHFGASPKHVNCDIEDFLRDNNREYDITIFMGLLYHILNPFAVMKAIGSITKNTMVIETVLASNNSISFVNSKEYSPTNAGFFVRIDSAESHTAGTNDLELWPNEKGLRKLLCYSGFSNFEKCNYGEEAPNKYLNNQRIIGVASK